MRRKLVKQGASTLMVSLPAKWIQEHDLTKGSEISITPISSGLLISASDSLVKKETEISLTHDTYSFIKTSITTTYRMGYDRIKVNYETDEQFKILNEVMKDCLIGFEVVEKKDKYCLVENITEPSEDQFETILKKIFQNITSLFHATKERLIDPQKRNLSDIQDIGRRIQKYDNFCRRVICKRKFRNKDSELFWTFLTLIIHAQRELYHVNKLLEKKASNKLIDYLEKVENMYNLIVETYYNKNKKNIGEIHDLENVLIQEDGYNLVRTLSKENVLVSHLICSVRLFYQANTPLFGLII